MKTDIKESKRIKLICSQLLPIVAMNLLIALTLTCSYIAFVEIPGETVSFTIGSILALLAMFCTMLNVQECIRIKNIEYGKNSIFYKYRIRNKWFMWFFGTVLFLLCNPVTIMILFQMSKFRNFKAFKYI